MPATCFEHSSLIAFDCSSLCFMQRHDFFGIGVFWVLQLMWKLCDTVDFVVSSLASGCLRFVSVYTTRCWCRGWYEQSNLLAEKPASGLTWGTEWDTHIFGNNLTAFNASVKWSITVSSAPAFSSLWMGTLWWPSVFAATHTLWGQTKTTMW